MAALSFYVSRTLRLVLFPRLPYVIPPGRRGALRWLEEPGLEDMMTISVGRAARRLRHGAGVNEPLNLREHRIASWLCMIVQAKVCQAAAA